VRVDLTIQSARTRRVSAAHLACTRHVSAAHLARTRCVNRPFRAHAPR
jgi:hypothetical protein